MPSPYYTAILSGFSTSTPGIYVDRPAPALTILVPSQTAADLRVEYGATSAGPYGALVRQDGSGVAYSAWSGSAPATAVVPHVGTPYARLTTGATMTTTVSYTILVTRAYP